MMISFPYQLKPLLAQPQLDFAVLVGSRATGTAHDHSDWDIALQWAPQLDWLTVLSRTETLRSQLADASDQPIPVSGYDAFKALANGNLIAQADLPAWNAIIGLRNRIVHDYMNIDMVQVLALVATDKDQFVAGFLRKEFLS